MTEPDRPLAGLSPEQRRARLIEVRDALTRAPRAVRRQHIVESRRRLRAEAKADR